MEVVDKSQEVGNRIDAGDYEGAVSLRGHSFQEQLRLLKLMTATAPTTPPTRGNLLILTSGHDAPGMNPCVRVATRVAIDHGFNVLGASYGLAGLLREEIRPLSWMDVSGWASGGGSELGAGRIVLQAEDVERLAQIFAQQQIVGVVCLGGIGTYQNFSLIRAHQDQYPSLQIPMVLIPASINNNLPGTEFSIGSDTALNNVIEAIDKIKDTAGANQRAFVIEVMGFDCGYLALMAALASGAEQVYLPEEGITLQQIVNDVGRLRQGFERGKLLSILILNERASTTYRLDMIQSIMDEEGGSQFDVRSVVLGHIQRGGSPSPFDRILAARLGAAAVNYLTEHAEGAYCRVVGLSGKHIITTDLGEAMMEIDWPHERPHKQWFMELRELARIL